MNKLLLLLPIILIGFVPSAFAEMTEIEMVTPFTEDENGEKIDDHNRFNFNIPLVIFTSNDPPSHQMLASVPGDDPVDYIYLKEMSVVHDAFDMLEFKLDYSLKHPDTPEDYRFCLEFTYKDGSPVYNCYVVGADYMYYCTFSDYNCVSWDNGEIDYGGHPYIMNYVSNLDEGNRETWTIRAILYYHEDYYNTATGNQILKQNGNFKTVSTGTFELVMEQTKYTSTIYDDSANDIGTVKYQLKGFNELLSVSLNQQEPQSQFSVTIDDVPITEIRQFTLEENDCLTFKSSCPGEEPSQEIIDYYQQEGDRLKNLPAVFQECFDSVEHPTWFINSLIEIDDSGKGELVVMSSDVIIFNNLFHYPIPEVKSNSIIKIYNVNDPDTSMYEIHFNGN